MPDLKAMLLPTLLLAAPAAFAADPPEKAVFTYDLTPTLALDRNAPAQRRRIWDEAHLVASLQGLVNRAKPLLYLFYVGGQKGEIDRFWLDRMREKGDWLADAKLEPIPTLAALVATFRSDVKGVVAYDENVPATSNVASTAAGAESMVCARFDRDPGSLFQWLTADPQGPKLPVKVWLVNRDGSPLFTGQGTIPGSKTPSTGSSKCDPYIWAKEAYLDTGKCKPERMGYYLDAWWLRHPDGDIPNHTLTNHDFVIARQGFLFDLAPWEDETPVDDKGQPLGADVRTLQAVLRSAWERMKGGMIHVAGFVPWDKKYTGHAGGKHADVESEWRYSEIISCFNGYMDADALGLGCMANASFFQHYPLQDRYPQKLPTRDDLKARMFVDPDGRVAPRSFVSFYIGDYDSAAWLYRRIPDIWTDPARGAVPLGWAFNPNLADRMAPAMAWVRKTKTPNDYFVAGDSGAGYLNPGHLQEPRRFSGLPSGVRAWTEHCRRHYARWDLSLTGFIIDGFAPAMDDEVKDAYALFSPAGIVAQKVPQRGLHKGMPVLRMNLDLDGPPEKAAERVLGALKPRKPDFQIFRTILWKPSAHRTLFETIRARNPDVEIVDPYTLFLLLKLHEGGGR